MIERIRRIQLVNNQFFAVIGNYTQQIEEQEEALVSREFQPPMHPNYRPSVQIQD